MKDPNIHRNRREFLSDFGMGFTGIAMASLLQQDGFAMQPDSSNPNTFVKGPHFAPKAKNVIWLFMIGGTSHLESFDPKPELNKYAGKTIEETPYKYMLSDSKNEKNLRVFVKSAPHQIRHKLYPLQKGFSKYGESGIEICDWWPHIGKQADNIAFIRSMWTTDNNHGAQLQFHTGRHILDGYYPTIGSWVHYGLGSMNENLPQFVVLGTPIADCCGGKEGHGASYLGPQYAGVQFDLDKPEPLPFVTPGPDVYKQEQQAQFALLNKLNRHALGEYPNDPEAIARIKSYELAFKMQSEVPQLVELANESKHIQELYGMNEKVTKPFGEKCLTARRLVEKGVRFVQVFHGSNGGAGAWDAHGKLRSNHQSLSKQVDQPIAALIQDLKQRGLLDETLVVWATEFGRTPGAQGSDGRDHHPYGFSVFMAGGGIKGGIVHGATDELGFHAVENRHYVTDIHATVLHQLGIDHRRLHIPGKKRLEIEFGEPIKEIMA